MAIGMTTSAQVGALPQEVIDRTMLERALPYLPHALFGQRKKIPQKSGEKPKFTRFNSLPKGVKLQEGVNPEPYQLSKTSVEGQLETWGAYVKITDYVEYTTQDNLRLETATLLGENSGETFDSVYRDVIAAGTSVYHADAVASRGDVATGPDADDLDMIILALRNNKAKTFTEIINPTTGVGTVPVADAYFSIVSFEGADRLRQNIGESAGWIPVEKYPSQTTVVRNEIGAYRNIRFIATTEAKVFEGEGSGGADVHTALIFGRNAYGICPLSGKSLENIVKSPKEIGGPLEQYGTSGWKGTSCCLILNQSFMYRYEFLIAA